MCELEFDGRLDFWEKRHPIARHAYRCVLCECRIEPGDRYLREVCKWEGDVHSSPACLDCEKDRDEFAKAHDGASPFMDSFWDYLTECVVGDYVGDAESEQWRPMLMRIIDRIPLRLRTEGVLQWLEPEEAE